MRKLREKIERMKIVFSIFYEQIEETPRQEVISEINQKIQEINAIHKGESDKLDLFHKRALHTGKNSDVTALSNMQLLFDSFSKGCETQVEFLVTKMQDIEESMRPYQNTRSKTKQEPATAPTVAPSAPSAPFYPGSPATASASSPIKPVTFAELIIKFSLFITSCTEFYAAAEFNLRDFQLAKEIVNVMGNPITIDTSDVRGDGACGFRAILTSYLLKCGINLPWNPDILEGFILELKNCMLDLLLILNENPENHEFIRCLLSNPDNGSANAKNISEWFQIISDNGYCCTDGDIRLIAILFGMLPHRDRIIQINVLKLRPVEHNPYQSFNCYGNNKLEPVCSNSHINIIHTGGHYRAVVKFSGVLHPIESVDAEIILPPA